MHYIVFDLEFTQPESKDKMIVDPIVFNAEIIQIGAVKLNEQYRIIDTFDALVEPVHYTHISQKVEQTIRIHHGGANRKYPFPLVCESFFEFCGNESYLLSWGEYDIQMLEKNMIMHGLSTSIIPPFYDVQAIYAEKIKGSKPKTALQDAVKKTKVSRYVVHNAFDDAYSAAEVLARLPSEEKAVAGCTFIQATKSMQQDVYFQEAFSSKREAFKRFQVCKIACKCGQQLPLEGVFILSKNSALATAKCGCGAEYFVYAGFGKSKSGKIALKIQRKPMTSELRERYEREKRIYDAIKSYAEKKKSKSGDQYL